MWWFHLWYCFKSWLLTLCLTSMVYEVWCCHVLGTNKLMWWNTVSDTVDILFYVFKVRSPLACVYLFNLLTREEYLLTLSSENVTVFYKLMVDENPRCCHYCYVLITLTYSLVKKGIQVQKQYCMFNKKKNTLTCTCNVDTAMKVSNVDRRSVKHTRSYSTKELYDAICNGCMQTVIYSYSYVNLLYCMTNLFP